MNDLRLAVVGAAGRMGRMLLQTIPDTLGMRLSGALESANSPIIGQDSGALIGADPNGVLVSAEPESVSNAATCSSISPLHRRPWRWQV